MKMLLYIYEELDVVLLQLFCQKQVEGVFVSDLIYVQKAKIFHKATQLEGEFNFSSGWLTTVKQ